MNNQPEEGAIWLQTGLDGKAMRYANGAWVPLEQSDKRDPNDPFWADAEFGTLDASFCFLAKPRTRDTLIYLIGSNGSDPLNFHIPGFMMDKIINTLLKAYSSQNKAPISPG